MASFASLLRSLEAGLHRVAALVRDGFVAGNPPPALYKGGCISRKAFPATIDIAQETTRSFAHACYYLLQTNAPCTQRMKMAKEKLAKIRNLDAPPSREGDAIDADITSRSTKWTSICSEATRLRDFEGMTLEQLEEVIREGVPAFVSVGLALTEIRDRCLFRPKYSRFEDYCRSTWGFCRQTGHRVMAAAQIVLELSPIGDTNGVVWNESQIRPLSKLPTQKLRQEALSLAVARSATKRPTAGQVKAAVDDLLLRAQVDAAKTRDAQPLVATGEGVRIIHGDTGDRDLLESGSVNLIIGSPPYNIGAKYPTTDDALESETYLAKMRVWLTNCHRWLVPEGGRLCLNVPIDTRKFGPFPLASEITGIARGIGLGYEATIVWDEASHKGHWNQIDAVASPLIFCRCEAILIFSKGGFKRGPSGEMPDVTRQEVEEWCSGYWRFAGSHQHNRHPCPFPPELPRRLIKLLSYPTDVVLDPWAGTGTTLIEAMKLKRRAVGIEIEESYCALIRERVSATHPSP